MSYSHIDDVDMELISDTEQDCLVFTNLGTPANYVTLIESMEAKWVVSYLEKENTNPQEILKWLKCLLGYYDTRDQGMGLEKVVTNNVKTLLLKLCTVLNTQLLRNTAEQLLMHLFYELYCTSAYEYEEIEIFQGIHDLPDNYNDWPTSRAPMFFVFAYLQLLHSRCLWEHNVILEAANAYMSLHGMVPCIALKALAWLYPMLSNENFTLSSNIKNRLLMSLTTCKSLGSFLTYDTVQMGWLLQEADATLKTRLLATWLKAKGDAEVLKVLNATKKGHFLLEIFLTGMDSEIGSRVVKLFKYLDPYPDFIDSMKAAAPLYCEGPEDYHFYF